VFVNLEIISPVCSLFTAQVRGCRYSGGRPGCARGNTAPRLPRNPATVVRGGSRHVKSQPTHEILLKSTNQFGYARGNTAPRSSREFFFSLILPRLALSDTPINEHSKPRHRIVDCEGLVLSRLWGVMRPHHRTEVFPKPRHYTVDCQGCVPSRLWGTTPHRGCLKTPPPHSELRRSRSLKSTWCFVTSSPHRGVRNPATAQWTAKVMFPQNYGVKHRTEVVSNPRPPTVDCEGLVPSKLWGVTGVPRSYQSPLF
jgi:hypothetical protein